MPEGFREGSTVPHRWEKLPLSLSPCSPQPYNWLALPYASPTTPRPFHKRGNEAALCGWEGVSSQYYSTQLSVAATVPLENTRRGPERHSSPSYISQPQPLVEPPASQCE